MSASPSQQYPQSYPPAPPGRSGMPTWLIVVLVLVLVVVVALPVMSVVAIYGVRKYIANAKTAEAKNAVAQIARDAVAAYERNGKICPSASSPVPLRVPSAAKYQSTPAEWNADVASNAGFACLQFSIDMPQYFQYAYTSTPTSFTVVARGDLNGDGTQSEFKLEGHLAGGVLHVAPNIQETNPQE